VAQASLRRLSRPQSGDYRSSRPVQFQFLLPPPKKVTGMPRRLFAGPGRAMSPSVDAFADQAVDARHVDVICFVLDRA
jgi:hypothetical protein